MATVITSLATVIPVVGKTVLSYLWGGLSKASRLKILLDAGTGFLKQTFLIEFQYVWNYFMNNTGTLYIKNMFEVLFQNKVKTFHMISKSAGLYKGICSNIAARRSRQAYANCIGVGASFKKFSETECKRPYVVSRICRR